jgi:vacuolar-type H+-ATPase subunit H
MQNYNELYHYGVLGMRWGRHRYQNKYGVVTNAGYAKSKKLEDEYRTLANTKTLTEKGLKRKAQIADEYKTITGRSIGLNKSLSKNTNAPDKDSDVASGGKNIKDMTNEELQAHNLRSQLENTYLTNQSRNDKPLNLNFYDVQGKRLKDMSNEELQVYNTRKQLEETYLKYQPKPEISKGKKFVSTVMTKVVAPVAIKAGQEYLKKIIDERGANKTVNKMADEATDSMRKQASKMAEEAVNSGRKAAEEMADEVWSGTVEDTPKYLHDFVKKLPKYMTSTPYLLTTK